MYADENKRAKRPSMNLMAKILVLSHLISHNEIHADGYIYSRDYNLW